MGKNRLPEPDFSLAEKNNNGEIIFKACKYCQSKIPQNAKKCAYCGESQGKSRFLKIIIVIIVVILVLIVAMALFGTRKDTFNTSDITTESVNQDNSESPANSSDLQESKIIEISKENLTPVLYDKDGIKVTVKNFDLSDGFYNIDFFVENNSDIDDVSATLSNVSINDYEVPCYLDLNTISAGKKGICESTIEQGDLNDLNIEEWNNIECDFLVEDDSLGEIFSVPVIIDKDCWDNTK